jgi:cell division control protein 6
METIREDFRFEDLAHEEATISTVVRERLKQFRSKK